VLNCICLSCGSKDRLMISKFSTAALSASFCFQRFAFITSPLIYACVYVILSSSLYAIHVMISLVCWCDFNPFHGKLMTNGISCKLEFFFVQFNQPHTFVVVTLDPPIRKGQTLYPHIVLQVLLIVFHLNISVFFFFSYDLATIHYSILYSSTLTL
jgi:hypothetical protein